MLKSKLRFLLIFLLFTLNGAVLWAQDSLSVDSSRLEIRQHKTSLAKLKTQKDYQYGFEVTPPLNNWWERFINSVVKAYDDFFNDVSKGSYRKFFFILVITLALAYLVLRFLGVDVSSPFQRKEKHIEMGYYSEKETIHGRDFKKEIEAAINIDDFKLAIRLYYLKTLKTLADKNLIVWQPNKTNRSYYHELKPAVQKDFGSLTDAFEYSWYGNFEVGKADFDEIKMKFENFKI